MEDESHGHGSSHQFEENMQEVGRREEAGCRREALEAD